MAAVRDGLPSSSKPRIVYGCGDPFEALQAIACGMDVVESAFAYETTQVGHALTFGIPGEGAGCFCGLPWRSAAGDCYRWCRLLDANLGVATDYANLVLAGSQADSSRPGTPAFFVPSFCNHCVESTSPLGRIGCGGRPGRIALCGVALGRGLGRGQVSAAGWMWMLRLLQVYPRLPSPPPRHPRNARPGEQRPTRTVFVPPDGAQGRLPACDQ